MKISLPDIFPSEEILITEVQFQHEIEFYVISTTHFLAGDIFSGKVTQVYLFHLEWLVASEAGVLIVRSWALMRTCVMTMLRVLRSPDHLVTFDEKNTSTSVQWAGSAAYLILYDRYPFIHFH